jgi:hypothetical protein
MIWQDDRGGRISTDRSIETAESTALFAFIPSRIEDPPCSLACCGLLYAVWYCVERGDCFPMLLRTFSTIPLPVGLHDLR